MRPIHHSHSFCSPIFLAETLGLRALKRKRKSMKHVVIITSCSMHFFQVERLEIQKKQRFPHLLGTSMLMMQVSRSSPYRSVHVARIQRWSWDRQYPTNSTLYFCDASPNVSPSSVCLSFTGARMNGGVYRRKHSGLCRLEGGEKKGFRKNVRPFCTDGYKFDMLHICKWCVRMIGCWYFAAT